MSPKDNRGRRREAYFADPVLDALDEKRVGDLVCAVEANGDFALEFGVEILKTKRQTRE